MTCVAATNYLSNLVAPQNDGEDHEPEDSELWGDEVRELDEPGVVRPCQSLMHERTTCAAK
jgi:hypothetical protein